MRGTDCPRLKCYRVSYETPAMASETFRLGKPTHSKLSLVRDNSSPFQNTVLRCVAGCPSPGMEECCSGGGGGGRDEVFPSFAVEKKDSNL